MERGNFSLKWSTSKGGPLCPVGPLRPKLAVPFPKLLVFSPALLGSSQNFGRNVNGSLDSIGNFLSTEKCLSIFSR